MKITFYSVEQTPPTPGKRLLLRLAGGHYVFGRQGKFGWIDDWSKPIRNVEAWAVLGE